MPFPFFRRRPAPQPPIDLRGETWRAGELAVCVNDTWKPESPFRHPKLGEVRRVLKVEEGAPYGRVAYWLHFSGSPCGYRADHFRKPVADREPASAAFVERIKRPARVSALAALPELAA